MQNDLRRCLEDCDVVGARRLWAHLAPHLPQPKTDGDALVVLHHARTQAESISLRLRAYSHRWLFDRGFPSGLPDHLRPRADRIYPRIIEAVGISVRAVSPERADEARAIQAAMSDAVMHAYADGRREPEFVKARMAEARRHAMRRF